MKRLTARLLRRLVRDMKKVIETLDPPAVPYNSINPNFAYCALNEALQEMRAANAVVYCPQYGWGVLHAAHLARALDLKQISVIEFGVSGGNGLVELESVAESVEARFGVQIDVHGFDTGRGLPPPADRRDMPHNYRPGEYVMDLDKLRARLRRAQLHIGLVRETIPEFIRARPSPIGFVSFDLDLYTSTMDAFAILEQEPTFTLPRVQCYFDDIMGLSFSQFTGERAAIEEFNATHQQRKIAPIFGLKYFLAPPFASQQWSEMFYLAHIFDHPLVDAPDGLTLNAQTPLDDA